MKTSYKMRVYMLSMLSPLYRAGVYETTHKDCKLTYIITEFAFVTAHQAIASPAASW